MMSMSKRNRRFSTIMLKQVGNGYLIVLIFFILFAILLLEGSVFHHDIGQPIWASALALVLILTILIPPVIRYLGPRLTGIKIPNIIEFSIAQLKRQSYLSEEFTDKIASHINIGKTGVSMFPSNVRSLLLLCTLLLTRSEGNE